MNFHRCSLLIVAGLLLLLMIAVAGPSAAAHDHFPDGATDFSLSIGYANVNLDSSSLIENEGALRFEPSITFSPLQPLPQLRLGADVGVSMVLDNSSRTIISNDGRLIFAGSSDVPLWLLEPELRLSWRQSLGENRQFFVEPGIAGGVAWAFLELNANDGSGDSYSKDDSTLYYRVFLRAGAQVTGGMAGIEGSWLSGGHLDLGDNASGDLSEFYIGIFGSLLF